MVFFLKIIDFHVHPLSAIKSNDLLAEMKKANVEKAVILSMELEPDLLKTKKLKNDIAKHFEYTTFFDLDPIYAGMDYVLHMGNTPMDYVADLVKANKNDFIGFGSVHVGYKSRRFIKKKLQIIKQLQEELGFKGIKILPTLQFYNPETSSGLIEVFKFAEKRDLIVTCHTGCDPGPWEIPLLSVNGNPLLLKPLLNKYKTKVILAHMGSYSSRIPGLWFEEAAKVVHDYKNVYGDLSAVPYLVTQPEMVETMRRFNIFNKILYGSDYPVTSAGAAIGMSTIVNIVKNSELLEDYEKENIFYYNAESLLK